MAVLAVVTLAAGACGGDDDESAASTTRVPATSTTSTTAASTTTAAAPDVTTTTGPASGTTYDGTGDQRIEITKPRTGPVVVVLSHDGSTRFSVRGLDADGEVTDQLVDAAGAYRGSRPLDLAGETTKFLDIQADGTWHIAVQAITTVRHFDPDATGSGDEFLFYAGDSGDAHWTHDGAARFVVKTYTGTGGNDLVDARGPYDETVTMNGPGYVEVVADGSWTVEVA